MLIHDSAHQIASAIQALGYNEIEQYHYLKILYSILKALFGLIPSTQLKLVLMIHYI